MVGRSQLFSSFLNISATLIGQSSVASSRGYKVVVPQD
ncbi:hypothetical protein V6Z12_D05G424700 [Gossypium hirsutum]